jgi:acylpyruvate hydrolase
MRPVTIRLREDTRAIRLDEDRGVDLGASDLVAVLRRPGWQGDASTAGGGSFPVDEFDCAPLLIAPEKIVCVGLNYRAHILEMVRDLPTNPSMFARALVGANDDFILPRTSNAVDWEAELALVIGATVRNADRATAGRTSPGTQS